MYTYTTVIDYRNKDGGDTYRGILATTTDPNIAVEAFKKAMKGEHPNWHIHSIEIFKTISDRAIDFWFATSGATETMPVCSTRRNYGGFGYKCDFGEFAELLRET